MLRLQSSWRVPMKPRFALILLTAAVALPASADTKIKTKTTAMGHSSESTVYIKGARKRDEMNLGPYSHVSIMQCDQKRIITFCPNSKSYTVYKLDDEDAATPAATKTAPKPKSAKAEQEDERAGGVQTINVNTTDTGERQTMFGFAAR